MSQVSLGINCEKQNAETHCGYNDHITSISFNESDISAGMCNVRPWFCYITVGSLSRHQLNVTIYAQ